MAKAKKRKVSKNWLSSLSKRRRIVYACAIFLSLVLMFILVQVLLDYRKLSLVKSDLDEAKTVLIQKGFDVKTYEDCYKLQGKFGSGAKICETGFYFTEAFPENLNSSIELSLWASEKNNEFVKTIDSLQLFKKDKELNTVKFPLTSSGSRNSNHIYTDSICGSSVYYLDTERAARYNFSCTTTPWLMKTFQL